MPTKIKHLSFVGVEGRELIQLTAVSL